MIAVSLAEYSRRGTDTDVIRQDVNSPPCRCSCFGGSIRRQS